MIILITSFKTKIILIEIHFDFDIFYYRAKS